MASAKRVEFKRYIKNRRSEIKNAGPIMSVICEPLEYVTKQLSEKIFKQVKINLLEQKATLEKRQEMLKISMWMIQEASGNMSSLTDEAARLKTDIDKFNLQVCVIRGAKSR